MALTADDVRDYLGAQPGGPIAMEQVEKALVAAEQRVAARIMAQPDPRPPRPRPVAAPATRAQRRTSQ